VTVDYYSLGGYQSERASSGQPALRFRLHSPHYIPPRFLPSRCFLPCVMQMFFVLDLKTGGDLEYYLLHMDRCFTEEEVRFFAAEVVLGVKVGGDCSCLAERASTVMGAATPAHERRGAPCTPTCEPIPLALSVSTHQRASATLTSSPSPAVPARTQHHAP